MATDDERREVAERLREQGIRFYSPSAWNALGEALGIGGARNSDTVCDRLADLIDPDCEEGRYSVARTARPVDRDALLALADCVRKMGEGYDKLSSFGLGTTFRAIADRIREALGVDA